MIQAVIHLSSHKKRFRYDKNIGTVSFCHDPIKTDTIVYYTIHNTQYSIHNRNICILEIQMQKIDMISRIVYYTIHNTVYTTKISVFSGLKCKNKYDILYCVLHITQYILHIEEINQ